MGSSIHTGTLSVTGYFVFLYTDIVGVYTFRGTRERNDTVYDLRNNSNFLYHPGDRRTLGVTEVTHLGGIIEDHDTLYSIFISKTMKIRDNRTTINTVSY